MEGKNDWVINSSEEISFLYFKKGQTAVFGHTYKIICLPLWMWGQAIIGPC